MSRASTLCCPTCGGPVADGADPAELLDGFAGGGRMRAILEAYVLAYPRKISRSNLIDRIYADDADGGADTAHNIVSVLNARLRTKLEPMGWTINLGRSGQGNIAHFGLVRLPALSGTRQSSNIAAS